MPWRFLHFVAFGKKRASATTDTDWFYSVRTRNGARRRLWPDLRLCRAARLPHEAGGNSDRVRAAFLDRGFDPLQVERTTGGKFGRMHAAGDQEAVDTGIGGAGDV